MNYSPIQIGNDTLRYALVQEGKHTLFVLGLNPSTADAEKPDKTMKAVIKFAEYNGYDGFVMLNLYPLRATNPNDLPSEADLQLHRKNLEEISKLIEGRNDIDVWLAFGANAKKRHYLLESFQEIVSILELHNAHFICFGKLTKNGCPPHPLYRKSEVFRKFLLESLLAPKEVRNFAAEHHLGSIIKFSNKKRGYDVYIIGSMQDFGPLPPPTGLPIAVAYKTGEPIIFPKGYDVFEWFN